MSEEVGLRTQYLNWKNNFPTDLGIEPHWIVLSFEKPGGWIESLPGLPKFAKSRLRGALEIREGLKHGPFDATFVAVHSALAALPGYVERNACFTTLDVTPKQLQDFGDFYGKHPSKSTVVEAAKHNARAKNYQSYRRLFPWSHWAAESLVKDYGVATNKIHVVPPGVDTAQWAPHGGRTESDICKLLFVGGHFDRKGGQILLDWAKTTTHSNWHLDIVTRQKLDIVDRRITVHNNLSSNDRQLTELYQNSDVFVLPTLADCYSIAGIEALASGLPVILSLTGGTGDVVKDGVTGFLLTDNTVGTLNQKLITLIADRALIAAMSKEARADAVDRYDVTTNIRKTVNLMLDSI